MEYNKEWRAGVMLQGEVGLGILSLIDGVDEYNKKREMTLKGELLLCLSLYIGGDIW